MADLDKLRSEYEAATEKAAKLQSDKDDAVSKARDRFADRLRTANDEAASAQKALMDAEAAHALAGRDDAEITAERLGLDLAE